jgi:hypothetical protein
LSAGEKRPGRKRAGQPRSTRHVDARLDVLTVLVTRQTKLLDAIARKLFLDPDDLDYPERLTAQRFGLQSQGDEEGILLALLHAGGGRTRRFVELGCGGNGGNSGLLASELGWNGLMVDAREDPVAECRLRFSSDRVTVAQHWITRENVNDIIREHGLAGEVDVLSIDIDGNDYWVWEALAEASPRVVVIEYNARFGPERAVVVPYDPAFDRRGGPKSYFGASLSALAKLAERKGYRLVTTEPGGANAFFVRDDVATDVPAVGVRDAFRNLLRRELLYRLPLTERKRDRVLRPESVYDEAERLGLRFEEL